MDEQLTQRLSRRWAEVRAAIGLLTRLPVGAAGSPVGAAWAFPLVGALVGLIGAGVAAVALAVGFAPVVAALMALAVTVLATGALHEDGLADTADGLGGGRDPAAKLAIMKDSRIGTYGVLALMVGIGLRLACLGTMPPGRMGVAIIAAQILGRALLPMIMGQLAVARPQGLGAMAGRPSEGERLVAAGIGLLAALLLLGLGRGLAAALAAGLATVAVAVLARRQIGGYTGDILGAAEQGAEILVLLTAAL